MLWTDTHFSCYIIYNFHIPRKVFYVAEFFFCQITVYHFFYIPFYNFIMKASLKYLGRKSISAPEPLLSVVDASAPALSELLVHAIPSPVTLNHPSSVKVCVCAGICAKVKVLECEV